MSYEIDLPDDVTDQDEERTDHHQDTDRDHPRDGRTPGHAPSPGRGGGHGHGKDCGCGGHGQGDGNGHGNDCGCGGHDDAGPHAGGGTESVEDTLEEAVGLSIPAEYIGAFVAEVFEDAERDTSWTDVEDAFVDPSARAAWDDLESGEQAVEILDAATRYDERAIEHLESIPLDVAPQDDPDGLEEALRCRRNADMFRDGLAAAYGDGVLEDADLVTAVEQSTFDADRIAARESALEDVDAVHDVDFRPYGGQFFDTERGPDPDVDHDVSETW
jgi:hypothetical protein